jgi:hypothetical protein
MHGRLGSSVKFAGQGAGSLPWLDTPTSTLPKWRSV